MIIRGIFSRIAEIVRYTCSSKEFKEKKNRVMDGVAAHFLPLFPRTLSFKHCSQKKEKKPKHNHTYTTSLRSAMVLYKKKIEVYI